MPTIRLGALPPRLRKLVEDLRRKEDRLSLLLSLVIGALVGLVVAMRMFRWEPREGMSDA